MVTMAIVVNLLRTSPRDFATGTTYSLSHFFTSPNKLFFICLANLGTSFWINIASWVLDYLLAAGLGASLPQPISIRFDSLPTHSIYFCSYNGYLCP